MKILITGSNGFLGSNLVSLFQSNSDHDVVSCSRFPNKHSKKHFILQEINGNTDWSESLQEIDVVIHCAGINDNKVLFDNTELINRYIEVDINGSKNLINQAAKYGVKQFIFISSVKVYGEFSPKEKKFSVDSDINPETIYGFSKCVIENEIRSIASNQNIRFTIIRPPIIYGPGVKGNIAFIKKLISLSLPIPVKGFASLRSIVSLDTLYKFIKICIESNINKSGIYNIHDIDISSEEMVRALALKLNKQPFIISKLFIYILTFLPSFKNMFNKLEKPLLINSKNTFQEFSIDVKSKNEFF